MKHRIQFLRRRREFITLLGGAAAASWPLATRAQGERMRRIGMLTAMSETDPTLPPRMAAFQNGLQAFGWAEGRNVSVVYRHATSDLDRLKSAALELVAAAPELIVVWSNPAVIAMRAVDRSVPSYSCRSAIRSAAGSSKAWGVQAAI
jgi:putative tryptophan/tyrosine transport system substrate-binding protein